MHPLDGMARESEKIIAEFERKNSFENLKKGIQYPFRHGKETNTCALIRWSGSYSIMLNLTVTNFW